MIEEENRNLIVVPNSDLEFLSPQKDFYSVTYFDYLSCCSEKKVLFKIVTNSQFVTKYLICDLCYYNKLFSKICLTIKHYFCRNM